MINISIKHSAYKLRKNIKLTQAKKGIFIKVYKNNKEGINTGKKKNRI